MPTRSCFFFLALLFPLALASNLAACDDGTDVNPAPHDAGPSSDASSEGGNPDAGSPSDASSDAH
jgi:hypothetical protein